MNLLKDSLLIQEFLVDCPSAKNIELMIEKVPFLHWIQLKQILKDDRWYNTFIDFCTTKKLDRSKTWKMCFSVSFYLNDKPMIKKLTEMIHFDMSLVSNLKGPTSTSVEAEFLFNLFQATRVQ